MSTAIETTPDALSPEELEVAGLIVSALSLETRAGDIAPEEPLFGAGLGWVRPNSEVVPLPARAGHSGGLLPLPPHPEPGDHP